MHLLLAVSGGIDSMYLANRAPELFPGARFAVAHCNFGLRGEESDGDQAFVEEWCRKRGVECFVRRFNTTGYASANHVSTEMAARELRYAWFAELCAEHGFTALVTAHNANDNAETLILNLLRGTGSRGLRGMAVSRDFHPENVSLRETPPTDFVSGPLPLTEPRVATVFQMGVPGDTPKLLRPLLGTSRKEIAEWMKAHGCGWREDSTNGESLYKRNIVRNEVFPVFERINPGFVATLNADMKRFAQADDIAEEYFRTVYDDVCDERGIKVDALLGCTHWKYVLYRLLESYGFSQETFDKLVALLTKYKESPRGTVTLGGKCFEAPSYVLRAIRGRLKVEER